MSSIRPSLSPSAPRASWPRQFVISSVVGMDASRFDEWVWCDVSGAVPGRARAGVGTVRDAVPVAVGGLLGALLALLHVAPDLVLVLLAAVVRAAEEVGGDLAAAEAERERAGEREHAEQSGVGDRHDLRRDVELVEDHEGPDRQDEPGHHGADDLAGGRV